MKNTKRLFVSVTLISFLLMGFSLPGCGNDPALKQQVEALQLKLLGFEQQLKVTRDESAINQRRVEEMAATLTAQSEGLSRLQTRLDAAQMKSSSKSPAKGVTKKPTKTLPSSKKKTGKKKGH